MEHPLCAFERTSRRLAHLDPPRDLTHWRFLNRDGTLGEVIPRPDFTETFLLTGTGGGKDKKWRKAWRNPANRADPIVAGRPEFKGVAFEEGARTKDWVVEWHQTRDFARLADYRKRVLVCVVVPPPPPRVGVVKEWDAFSWEKRPILYYGIQTIVRKFEDHNIRHESRAVWDIDQTPATPNPYAFHAPTGEETEHAVMLYSIKFSDLLLAGDARLSGKLARWVSDEDIDDRHLPANEKARKVWAFFRDAVEWRDVLVRHSFVCVSSWREVEGARTDRKFDQERETKAVALPVMFLTDFNLKAKSPAVKDMPAIADAWEEDRQDRRIAFLDEFRAQRDELKQSLLARVLNPERANRVAESFGLSLDEYMERL